MTNIIAVANQKGGVAKTTTAINLARALNKLKAKVLLVDFDPQGNATGGLGIDKDSLMASVYDCLHQEVGAIDAIVNTEYAGLDVLPAEINLAGAEQSLAQLENRAFALKDSLSTVFDRYDYVIIDCPPSLGLLTVNALTAATHVLAPIQCEYYALEGLTQLMDTIAHIQKSTNESLALAGVLMTMYDSRMRLSKQVVEEVQRVFGDVVYKTLIPRNVRLSEAPSYGKSVIDYDALSKGARAYMALAKEVKKHG